MEGRRNYLNALELARGQEKKLYRGLAATLLLREEIIAETDRVQSAIDLVSQEMVGQEPEHGRLINALLERFGAGILGYLGEKV